MMDTTYVGMDAHAASSRVAVLRPGAGPCGFALQRQLQAEGLRCQVIAPALIPRRPGDRVKTDRRAARQLAELLRAELRTVVHPPTPDQEAVRDLCRARADAVADRTRARHRLAKLLLRRGIAYDGRNWTQRHHRWLLTLRFEHPAAQATFDDYVRALAAAEERLRTLEAELAQQAASAAYCEAVGLLRCFRGVDTVTALTVLAELGDVTRFGRAPQFMAYCGLTPSESSAGHANGGGRLRRPATSISGACSSRAPGTTATRRASARRRGAPPAARAPARLGGGARRPRPSATPAPLPAVGRQRQAHGGG